MGLALENEIELELPSQFRTSVKQCEKREIDVNLLTLL
jgi:hypothetical protein